MSYKFFMDSTNLIQSIKNKIWRQKETVSQMTRMFMEVSYVRASPQHPHRTLRSRKHEGAGSVFLRLEAKSVRNGFLYSSFLVHFKSQTNRKA